MFWSHRRRWVWPAAAAVCLAGCGGGAAVQAPRTSAPAAARTAAGQNPGADPRFTTRLVLPATTIAQGAELEVHLEVTNRSGQTLSLSDRGCLPQWGVGLGTATPTVILVVAGTCEPGSRSVPPGTTSFPLTLKARRSRCTDDPSSPVTLALPRCAPPGQVPPLPLGVYEVYAGGISGLPQPAPVPITVVAPVSR
jgi:hypothetical protein